MSKPQLPKVIVVGPHHYTVTNDAKEHQKEVRKMGPDVYADGISNHRSTLITINPKQSFSQQQDTLWHEVSHACWRNSDWSTRIPKDDPEEYIVRRKTAIELDTWQRNPQMVEFLLYNELEDNTLEAVVTDPATDEQAISTCITH